MCTSIYTKQSYDSSLDFSLGIYHI